MKQLKPLITLIMISLLFVQITASSSINSYNMSNPSLNSHVTNNITKADYPRTDSQMSLNSENKQISLSQDKVTGIKGKNSTFNDGTVISVNNSYVSPGNNLDFTVNSSAWSNYNYNNSYRFYVQDPMGDLVINQSMLSLDNYTLTTNNSAQYKWKNQLLNSSYSHNATSTGINDEFFGKNINSVVATSINATSYKITWNSVGNVTSKVKYGLSASVLNKQIVKNTYENSHTVLLTNLNPNTTYYYQVFGTDIFNNVINDTVNQFKTDNTTTGFPTITNVVIQSVTNTNAIITMQTNLVTNATLFYSTVRNDVLGFTGGTSLASTTQNQSNHNFNFFDNLVPGTEYFFYIKANSGNNASFDDGSVLYNFVTKTNGIVSLTTSPLISILNDSYVQVNFSTSLNINSTIYYTSDYMSRFTVGSTEWHQNSTIHSFELKVNPGTRYYFKIGLKNSTNEYWIVDNVGSYFSFVSKTPVEKNRAVINLSLQIPYYPAILGTWSLYVKVNQINKTLVNAPNVKSYSISFLVNTSLHFNFKNMLLKTSQGNNESFTRESWKVFNNTSLADQVFSPGDNIGIIGTVSYGSTSGSEINDSDFTYTGSGDIYTDSVKLNENPSNLFDVDSNPINYNLTTIAGVNNFTMKFLRINIPSIDIFNNISVKLTFKFPSFTSENNYTQLESSLTLNVKYRLGVADSTGESSYPLTSSNVVGSATIFPYHWLNLKTRYGNDNLSNQLNIQGSQLNVSFITTKNGSLTNLFSSKVVNYTLYWFRQTLESSLEEGNYELGLVWHGNNDITRPDIVTSDTLYSNSPAKFSYSFSLNVAFEVKDLTLGVKVQPNQGVTLRFKIIVPETGVSWDKNLSPKIIGVSAPITFKTELSEYQVTIKAGSTTGLQTLKVTLASRTLKGNDQLVFNVTEDIVEGSLTQVDTNPIKDVNVSLVDFALIIGSIAVVVIYTGYIFVYNKKK